MCKSKLNGKVVDVNLWIDIDDVESEAIKQLQNIASLPWAYHIAVMPDVHYGKGATVGSVIALKNAVSPASVGVDIGCGMAATKTNIPLKKVERKLKELRSKIEERIPVGFNYYNNSNHLENSKIRQELKKHFDEFKNLDSGVQNLFDKSIYQCGTLGGGNHFIEVCKDKYENVWIMLHSGSRNIGKNLADIHISIAKSLIHNQSLPDKDLSVFLANTPEMLSYRRDLYWAQQYALLNRKIMLESVEKVFQEFWPSVTFSETVMCHHNYVAEEKHFGEEVFVTRKGAISAKKGELGIIPGSMGTKSYIVEGLGNQMALNSASHGAGRKMSRSKARKMFTKRDLEIQTNGVECRKDKKIIDEIPGAYKDIKKVMKNQQDLVKIVVELKQILCVKG